MSQIINLSNSTPSPPTGYQNVTWQLGTTPTGTDSTTGLPIYPVSANIPTPANVVENEVPSGAINGTNTAYTLANTPVAGSVKPYVNGQRLVNGVDFTISRAVITLSMALKPASGSTPADNIIVDYRF